MVKKYDIFISYRREGGYQTADSIYQRLINAGYSAFLDMEQMASGTFNTKLLEVIDGCRDFILVLPPNAQDRCVNEDDWVRQEVEHAIRKGKNIVPVMLKGFDWPDRASLPESLRDLPNYNGISATDHNLFSENIERLKNRFLLSKRGITWRSHKWVYISIFAVLLAVLGITLSMRTRSNIDYEQVCQEVSMDLLAELAIVHNNVSIAKDILESWDDFTSDYTPRDSSFLIRDLCDGVDGLMKGLREPMDFDVSGEQIRAMKRHGIPAEELKLVPMSIEITNGEVEQFAELVKECSKLPQSKYIDRIIRSNYELLVLLLELECCSYLYMFSLMPDGIQENVKEAFAYLTLVPYLPLGQTAEYYEAMQQNLGNRMDELLIRMGGDADDAERHLESLKHKLNLMEDEVEAMLKEYDLAPEDDMMTMWNKIIGMADIVFVDVEDDVEYALEQYARLENQLLRYQEYNSKNDPNTSYYISSAREYFKLVAMGKQRLDIGLLTLSAAEDQSYFKIGDIIIEADGKTIHSFQDFMAIHNQTPTVHDLKVLRLEDGSLKELTLKYDDSKPAYDNYAHLHPVYNQ